MSPLCGGGPAGWMMAVGMVARSWPNMVGIQEINQDRTGWPLFGHILLMQLFDINQMRNSLVSHQTSVIIVRLQ